MSPVNSAEAKVAAALRAAGIACECNVFIDSYEVDLLIADRIVIEVDGYHHYARPSRERDSVKSEFLQAEGYQLLRIRNSDVHQPVKLRAFVDQVQQLLADRPGASIPANTPLAKPALQQLRDQLLQQEAAKRAAATERRKPPAPAATPKKNDRALFSEWLEREAVEDKDQSSRRDDSRRRR